MQTPSSCDHLSLSSGIVMDLHQQQQQQPYQYRTIHHENRNRLTLLPIYPTMSNSNHHNHERHLLLANVPSHLLSSEELSRRQHNFYPFPYQIPLNEVHYRSDIAEYYQRYYVSLINKFHIDPILLDCNYVRLRHCLDLFADDRQRRLRASHFDVQLREQERALAMEFFLQIDVDLFYMKVGHENLFCYEEPNCCFSMQACNDCELCSSKYKKLNHNVPSINGNETCRFIFCNGYQTILNANASCTTRNIIFVLRCLCQQYEYVGETSNNLVHCLSTIRKATMRYIHQKLLGQLKSSEIDMEYSRLYEHIVQCPLALQKFLDCNPRYWRFIPWLNQDVERQNTKYLSPWKSRSKRKEDDRVEALVHQVPLPPTGYRFNNEQYDQQRQFFRRDGHQELPEAALDLYCASIIVVVPEQTSNALRQFIQALLITHAETNLNVIGHLVYHPHPQSLLQNAWCHRLARPHAS